MFRNFKSGSFEKVYLIDNKDLEIEGKNGCLHKNYVRKSVDIKGCQIYSWSRKTIEVEPSQLKKNNPTPIIRVGLV